MSALTNEQLEWLLKACSGLGKITMQQACWYNETLCISSEPYRSQVDDDGVLREYQMLVRLLHTEDFKLFYIDVCECGVNKLDYWPDNSKHPQFILRNTGAVYLFLNSVNYPMCDKVRFYD